MKTFELTPINGRKSFNGKAGVIEENGVSQLRSYNTIVAEYNHQTNEIKVFDIGSLSATTLTHINAFLSHFGFDTCTKKQLIEYYNL